MASGLNKVTLIGNLGNDPEIRSTNDGRKIANFTLATSESWKDKSTGERKDKVQWHRIVIFAEGLVNVVENYAKKGSKIYIEGSLQTREWFDANENKRYTTEVVLQGFSGQLILLDSRNSSTSNNAPQQDANDSSTTFDNNDLDDEIPF